jgi:hypothetical protein
VKNNEDYIQISIPPTLTENLVGYFDSSIAGGEDPDG